MRTLDRMMVALVVFLCALLLLRWRTLARRPVISGLFAPRYEPQNLVS